MEALNDNCLLHVFSYLKLRDLARIEQVCTRFRDFALKSYRVYRNIDIEEEEIKTFKAAALISSKVGEGLQLLRLEEPPDDKILVIFLLHCRNIKHLQVSSVKVQESGSLEYLDGYIRGRTDMCKLKSVIFDFCYLDDVEDSRLFHCLEGVSTLLAVSLPGNFNLTGNCLKVFKNLKKMYLNLCPNLQPEHFIDFCKRNKTLISLGIDLTSLDQESINTIPKELKNLEEIFLSAYNYPELVDLSPLADLPKLVSLVLNFCNLSSIPLLNQLALQNRLQSLEYIFFKEECEKDIANEILNTSLKIQGLKKFSYVSQDDSFNDEHLKVSTIVNLKELEIPLAGVTDEGLYQFILRNPSLEFLIIRDCQKITDAFAEKIIPHLQTNYKSLLIDAHGTKVSAENIKILSKK